MNTITIHLPPEVIGCLSLAQRHLDANRVQHCRRLWRERERKRKHEEKAQKLVAKAARLLSQRGCAFTTED